MWRWLADRVIPSRVFLMQWHDTAVLEGVDFRGYVAVERLRVWTNK